MYTVYKDFSLSENAPEPPIGVVEPKPRNLLSAIHDTLDDADTTSETNLPSNADNNNMEQFNTDLQTAPLGETKKMAEINEAGTASLATWETNRMKEVMNIPYLDSEGLTIT